MQKEVLDFFIKSPSQRRGGEEYKFGRKKKNTRECWTIVKQKEKNGHNIAKCDEEIQCVCKTSHG